MLRKTDLDHTWLVVEIFDKIEISYFNKTNGILLEHCVYKLYKSTGCFCNVTVTDLVLLECWP